MQLQFNDVTQLAATIIDAVYELVKMVLKWMHLGVTSSYKCK